MYALVVKSLRIQRNRIFTDGKYLVDFHVLIIAEKLYDMQLVAIVVSQQRVRLHDHNMKLVDYNSAIVVLLLA
jgi:plasmid rolling circle replication initiator protein Rep